MEIARTSLIWQLIVRLSVGFYWIYFSSQRWFDPFWVRDILITALEGNYVPIYGETLRAIVAPNWRLTAIAVTALESVVGFMILLGIFTRLAASLGVLDSLNLTLAFSFCKCPWTEADFPLTFWFYFGPLLLNGQILFDESSKVVSVQRLLRRIAQRNKQRLGIH